MTDEERKLLNARIDGMQQGLDLAMKVLATTQRYEARQRLIQRARPAKKDAFDKFTDFITLDWLLK